MIDQNSLTTYIDNVIIQSRSKKVQRMDCLMVHRAIEAYVIP